MEHLQKIRLVGSCSKYGIRFSLFFIPVFLLCNQENSFASNDHSAQKQHSSLEEKYLRVQKKRLPIALVSKDNEELQVSTHRLNGRNTENFIGKALIEQQAPGTNILRAVGQLPGVTFNSSDPLGLDAWGTSLYIRGFFQNELGATLDGIPLNNGAYYSGNGVNVNNAAISGDIDRISVSQGAGAVYLPSNTNLGGTMQFYTSDPKDKFGGKIEQGFGSYGMEHSYFRFDSGSLNKSGTKFYVSYQRNFGKKYNSPAPDFMQQVDAKLVQPIGQYSKISAFFNWSDAEIYNYPDLSFDIIKNVGWNVRQFFPDYAAAYAAATWGQICSSATPSCASGAHVPAGWEKTSSGAGVAFYDGGQSTVDYLGGLNFDFTLTNRLKWITTVYGHSNTSYTTFGDPYDASETGSPISEEVFQPRQERYGINSEFQYKISNHEIRSGVWFENNNAATAGYLYNEPLLGTGEPLKTTGPYTKYGPAFFQYWGFQWNTNSFQYHLMDTWKPIKNLAVVYGFKSVLQTTSGGAYNNNESLYVGPLPNGSLTSSAAFLPHINIDWSFLPHHEIYFDVAENIRPYNVGNTGSSTTLSPWSVSVSTPTDGSKPTTTSQQLFDTLKQNLHPERDWVYVLGYRYNTELATFSIDGYHADISHRLVAASSGSLTYLTSTVIDSKKAEMWGADVSLNLRPIRGLLIGNTFSYNHFTYGSNVDICAGSGEICDIKGKKMTGYPSFIYKNTISYTWKNLTGHFDSNFYSSRPYSVMNDTKVPAYWLANAGASYKFGDWKRLRNIVVSFNVYNLFNSKYIGMMGDNGFPVSGDYQSLQRGAVRQFMGNASVEF